MRDRKAVEADMLRRLNSKEELFLEVLLDIRDLLNKQADTFKFTWGDKPNPNAAPVTRDPNTGFPRITGCKPDVIGSLHTDRLPGPGRTKCCNASIVQYDRHTYHCSACDRVVT